MSQQSSLHNSNTEELSSVPTRTEAVPARLLVFETTGEAAPRPLLAAEEKEPADSDASLDEAGKDEHEYVRRRLRDELGREPSEEEVNEWLRRHTEGY
jgi:hypothetical protein